MASHPEARDRRRSRIWLILGLFILVLAGLLALKIQSAGVGGVSAESEGAPAPDFRLNSLQGDSVELGDYAGRVLLLELWATWCGPCRLQADILHELYEEVAGSDIEFLAVSLGESRDVVEQFVADEPFSYPVLLDPEETLGISLEVYALPTVVVIDGNGRVRFSQAGITDAGTLRSVLSEIGVEISA
ncbi:MAG: TlpA disulfide reductase family protein [Acidobacteriota bacterium]